MGARLWNDYQNAGVVDLWSHYAPSELVLEDPGMSCCHWLGRILVLVFLDGSAESKGLNVSHDWVEVR